MSKPDIPLAQNAGWLRRLCKLVSLYLVFVTFSGRADARTDVAAMCEEAARIVSYESGVPLDVLRSISLTETGRRKDGEFLPWPWTVNMEGVGKWFDNYAEAQAYVDRHFARGARSFDVGCFQINYRWHGQAFSSLEEMFDPLANARYAARFLTELHNEFGDWSRAAGAYHSRTPALARKYSARFDRIRARLPRMVAAVEIDRRVAAALPKTANVAARINRYPLLLAGERPLGLASLVPDSPGEARTPFLPLGGARPITALR